MEYFRNALYVGDWLDQPTQELILRHRYFLREVSNLFFPLDLPPPHTSSISGYIEGCIIRIHQEGSRFPFEPCFEFADILKILSHGIHFHFQARKLRPIGSWGPQAKNVCTKSIAMKWTSLDRVLENLSLWLPSPKAPQSSLYTHLMCIKHVHHSLNNTFQSSGSFLIRFPKFLFK